MPTMSPGICLVNDIFLLSHESSGSGEPHHLFGAHMAVIDIAFEFSRAYFHKRDTRPVVWIHVGVNLENET